MIWLQAVGCFLIWALYGVARMGRVHRVRNWARRVPRAARGLLAGALLVGPALAVGGAIVAFGPHIQYRNGLPAYVWVASVVAGLGFVHCQTLATALLVTLAEKG